ncbi:hypothetical protein L2E82_39577 [Cichorium intybus]|uniref:Uncharacterized protein n=1 Tax=Cichorium intybus TaxID=13427 RepID=A0ACB9AMZ6_CICIN|nr:hypothetical protein L2E82_39577 [Cichorium intybus]
MDLFGVQPWICKSVLEYCHGFASIKSILEFCLGEGFSDSKSMGRNQDKLERETNHVSLISISFEPSVLNQCVQIRVDGVEVGEGLGRGNWSGFQGGGTGWGGVVLLLLLSYHHYHHHYLFETFSFTFFFQLFFYFHEP